MHIHRDSMIFQHVSSSAVYITSNNYRFLISGILKILLAILNHINELLTCFGICFLGTNIVQPSVFFTSFSPSCWPNLWLSCGQHMWLFWSSPIFHSWMEPFLWCVPLDARSPLSLVRSFKLSVPQPSAHNVFKNFEEEGTIVSESVITGANTELTSFEHQHGRKQPPYLPPQASMRTGHLDYVLTILF